MPLGAWLRSFIPSQTVRRCNLQRCVIWDLRYQLRILQGHLHQQRTGFPDEGDPSTSQQARLLLQVPGLPRTMVTSLSHTVGRLGPETALPCQATRHSPWCVSHHSSTWLSKQGVRGSSRLRCLFPMRQGLWNWKMSFGWLWKAAWQPRRHTARFVSIWTPLPQLVAFVGANSLALHCQVDLAFRIGGKLRVVDCAICLALGYFVVFVSCWSPEPRICFFPEGLFWEKCCH